MKKLFLWAIFIYFLLAPLAYHPDNKVILGWAGVKHGSVWNIWKYQEKFGNFNDFGYYNYPPVHFYLDKVQYFVAKIFAGKGFDEWLELSGQLDKDEKFLPRYSLAIKIILISFTLVAGYLIYKIGLAYSLKEKQALLATGLWFFNPITIYSVAIMGQNDVLAIVVFLLGWLCYKKFTGRKRLFFASLFFGLSISVKLVPLLWLPVILAIFDKKEKNHLNDNLKIFFLSCFVFVLTLLPFIKNNIFRTYVLNGSGIGDRIFIPQINLGFSESILIVPILIFLTCFFAWKKSFLEKEKPLQFTALSLMTINLLLLGWSHFHPQWWTWVIPFWALWLVTINKEKRKFVYCLSGLAFLAWLVIIVIFQDSFLSIGLLITLNPNLANLPSINSLLVAKKIKVTDWNNYAHTFLAAVSISSLWLMSKEKDET